MTVTIDDPAGARSGKGHKDENFPVASYLIRPRHRRAVMAFYTFARTADDVADDPWLPADRKLALLDRMENSLAGHDDKDDSSRVLRAVLAEKTLSPQHGFDILRAFKTDVTKLRYADWDDLMEYCRYSAMPVGRFVLDVHGEAQTTWPASDALCAALQVINHLQDCAGDYKRIDRVYVPDDDLRREGIGVEALAEPKASPALRRVIVGLAARTQELLHRSKPFAGMIRDRRLAWEVAVIQALAERLNKGLMTRDPLSERVHFSKPRAALVGIGGILGHLLRRRAKST